MAPTTQNGGSQIPIKPNAFLSAQQPRSRDNGWEYGGSEPRSEGSRAASEEPGSYDVDDDLYDKNYENGTLTLHAPMPHGTETHDDILHPLREAANRVGLEVEKFAEALDEYNPLKADDDVEQHDMAFDMVDVFHSIAVETADRLREQNISHQTKTRNLSWRKKMRGFISPDVDEEMDDAEDEEPAALSRKLDATGTNDLKRWEEEAHTWDLLRRILRLRFPHPDSAKSLPKPAHKYSSERQIFENFLLTDSKALERETVLRWLKDTAEEDGEDIDILVEELQQNADRGDIVAHGWIHTKAAIKNNKRLYSWQYAVDPSDSNVQKLHRNSSKTSALVTQLDPDAPTRQDRKLEAQDEYFERAIWLGCFELLRRGKGLEEIKEWCQDRTEIWRAVSMSGLPDLVAGVSEDDPTYESTLIWRRMCYAQAKRGDIDAYERAVYGILSGDYESVISVCSSWNDNLFAHLNSLLRTQFESYVTTVKPDGISTYSAESFGIFDAVHYHGGEKDKLEASIIRSMRLDSSLSAEAKQPLKLIQGALIGDTFMDFTVQQGVALSNEINSGEPSTLIPELDASPEDLDNIKYITLDDHDSMRVLAHIYIIFKALGANLGNAETEHALENVVVTYINFLRLAGKEELISLYAAQLSEARCYDVLSRTMIDVVEEENRIVQIKLMTDLGLDVQRFVKLQTENLFIDHPEPHRGYVAEDSLRILLPAHGRTEEETLVEEQVDRDHEPSRIDSNFLGAPIERPDMLLIRSLEWHLLVDGLWSVTFRTGIKLYQRFYLNMKLSASKILTSNVTANAICLSKTPTLLGEELSLADMELDDEYETIPEDVDEEEVLHRKVLQKHMLNEARSYRELEHLMMALEQIWDAGNHIDLYAISANAKMRKDIRVGLNGVLTSLRPNMGAILHKDWLKTSRAEEPAFRHIRQAFLPEVILAFDHVLRLSGGILSRDNLLECINLSVMIAAEDHDLTELFVRKGRMAELVDAFAGDSLALLVATGPGKTKGGVSKKLRSLGWKRDIWALESRARDEV